MLSLFLMNLTHIDLWVLVPPLASCVPWTSYLTSPSQYFYVLNAVYNSHLLVKAES